MKMTLNEEIELLRNGKWFDKIGGTLPSDGILCVGYYAGKDERQHRHKWRLVTAMRSTQTLTKKVTHWMPLPKAPKEEKKDD